VEVTLDDTIAPVALFFGETQGRIVLSCAPDALDGVLAEAAEYDVPATVIGTVGPPSGTFTILAPDASIRLPVDEVLARYRDAIPTMMESGPR
jgi:phosphoribosylformylglycinamidine synthase